MNKSKRLEDYLKSIYLISNSNNEGIARVKEIADLMKVKTATVVYAMKKLNELNLIHQKKYGYVTLTDEGVKESKKILKKFNILYEFYTKILKVPSDIAFKDSCKAEHILSEETFEKMSEYLSKR